jgi:hypothetical protein
MATRFSAAVAAALLVILAVFYFLVPPRDDTVHKGRNDQDRPAALTGAEKAPQDSASGDATDSAVVFQQNGMSVDNTDVLPSGDHEKRGSARVRLINETHGFEQRIAAVHRLGAGLTASEVDELYEFLLTHGPDSLVKNDILNVLRSQQTPPPRLIELLTAIYNDTQQDPPLRDYALQHAALSYHGSALDDRRRIIQLLWLGVKEAHSSSAGTAIMGLQRLAREDALVDARQVAEAALTMAANPSANELARITATQVCGRLGVQAAVPTAETLSQSGASVPLRMAAIATLGDLGGPPQRALLERLAANPEPRMKRAALASLQRLSTRSLTR